MKKKLKKLNKYPFHMPGHKRNISLIKNNAFKMDFTEIEGSDNLHDPQGIIKSTMDFAAKLYNTNKTYLLVNGSTCGILSAISACTNMGDKILIARNCHKSVYNCILLKNLKPCYVFPPTIKYGISGGISPNDVNKALSENEDIKVFVMVSPTYEGIVSNIGSIANVCHKHNCLLIVDQAHGAHFSFNNNFPVSAAVLGADIVIESLHKTLPALTQTALLHICSKRAESLPIQKYLSIYQSSSPSYILMESIDACLRFMASPKGKAAMNAYFKNLVKYRKKLKPYLIIKKNLTGKCNVYDYDPGKLVFFGGKPLFEGLRKLGIECEMCSRNYTIAMTSPADTPTAFKMLAAAVKNLDMRKQKYAPQTVSEVEQVLTPGEADLLPFEEVGLFKSIGKISADFLYIYPPGIPITVPGEIITRQIKKIIELYIHNDFEVKGVSPNGTVKIINTK